MIRPFITEIALFVTPFAIYAVFLVATRSGVLDPTQWSIGRLAWLLMAALTLMIASFVVLANFTGAPPGSSYTPAHMENGVLVPGKTQ